MKKAVPIIALWLLGIGVSNTLTAQTKDETINWLKEKLEKNFQSHNLEPRYDPCDHKSWCSYELQSIEINECEIKYNVIQISHTYKISTWITYIFPTKGLYLFEGHDGLFHLDHNGITYNKKFYTKYKDGNSSPDTIKLKSGPLKCTLPSSNIALKPFSKVLLRFPDFGIHPNNEVDLSKRISKAITHLATFCPPPQKEAF